MPSEPWAALSRCFYFFYRFNCFRLCFYSQFLMSLSKFKKVLNLKTFSRQIKQRNQITMPSSHAASKKCLNRLNYTTRRFIRHEGMSEYYRIINNEKLWRTIAFQNWSRERGLICDVTCMHRLDVVIDTDVPFTE